MKRTDLFLLHGWGVGRAAWAPVVERLAATHPELRVTPLDLPGYGNTEATTDFAQAAQNLANRLPPGAVLCAWSLGAQLALGVLEGLGAGGGLVATVMSNLGLERFLTGRGLRLERTAVGDRYVVERMRGQGFNLGGEQSGHIVMTDYATTGDGLIAGLQFLAAMAESGRLASELVSQFEPVPQKLENVRFAGGKPLEAKTVKEAIADGEAQRTHAGFGDDGDDAVALHRHVGGEGDARRHHADQVQDSHQELYDCHQQPKLQSI